MMKNISYLALLLIFAQAAFAAGPNQRYIELAPGHRVWMTDQQVDQLALKTHRSISGFTDLTRDPNFTPVLVRTLGDLGDLTPKQQAVVNPMLQYVNAASLMAADKALESLGVRSYKTEEGAKAAVWIHDTFLKLANGRPDVTAGYFKHNFPQPSVYVEIKGQGPQAAERVILGAHEDSIVGPGADDDGSGVVTLLETFRALMASNYHPNRTITFITYAGEEGGLLGSHQIAAQFRANKTPVIGVLHLDMTMYPGKEKKPNLVSDYTNLGLSQFLAKLFLTYAQVQVQVTKCGYACSDHASWTANGYASAIPFESPFGEDNPYIHTKNDTSDKLDAVYGTYFVKAAIAFAVEMAAAQVTP